MIGSHTTASLCSGFLQNIDHLPLLYQEQELRFVIELESHGSTRLILGRYSLYRCCSNPGSISLRSEGPIRVLRVRHPYQTLRNCRVLKLSDFDLKASYEPLNGLCVTPLVRKTAYLKSVVSRPAALVPVCYGSAPKRLHALSLSWQIFRGFLTIQCGGQ